MELVVFLVSLFGFLALGIPIAMFYGPDVLRRHVGQHVRHDHPAVHAGRREQLSLDGHPLLRVRR